MTMPAHTKAAAIAATMMPMYTLKLRWLELLVEPVEMGMKVGVTVPNVGASKDDVDVMTADGQARCNTMILLTSRCYPSDHRIIYEFETLKDSLVQA